MERSEMKGDAEYVRYYYRVPAKRGRRIVFDGDPGTITGFRGARVLVRLDKDGYLQGRPMTCHPTWRMDYNDGSGEVMTPEPLP